MCLIHLYVCCPLIGNQQAENGPEFFDLPRTTPSPSNASISLPPFFTIFCFPLSLIWRTVIGSRNYQCFFYVISWLNVPLLRIFGRFHPIPFIICYYHHWCYSNYFCHGYTIGFKIATDKGDTNYQHCSHGQPHRWLCDLICPLSARLVVINEDVTTLSAMQTDFPVISFLIVFFNGR